MLYKKVLRANKTKLMLHKNSISCRQNQGDAAHKKVFCAQKSCFIFAERHAILSLFTPYAQMKIL